MTEPQAEYDDRLRRALNAAADGVVPSADGLERIRHRIAEQRSQGSLAMLIGWLTAALMDFKYLLWGLRSAMPPVSAALKSTVPISAAVTVALRSALTAATAAVGWATRRARHGASATVPAVKAAVPAVMSAVPAVMSAVTAVKAKVPERLRSNDGWLRPVLATAGAVVVAVVMILAIPGIRQNLLPTSNDVPSSQNPGQGGPGSPDGKASQPQGVSSSGTISSSPSPSASPPRRHTSSGSPQPSCSPAAPSPVSLSPAICSSASSAPVTSPTSASPSPTVSPSPTNTASPSPSPSDTPTPSTQDSSNASTGASSRAGTGR